MRTRKRRSQDCDRIGCGAAGVSSALAISKNTRESSQPVQDENELLKPPMIFTKHGNLLGVGHTGVLLVVWLCADWIYKRQLFFEGLSD